MSTQVTEHFTVEEFCCHDGTPYPVNQLDDEDPGRTWLLSRLVPLCTLLEGIRAAANGFPLTVNSGYRTLEYDEKIYEASAKDGLVAPASRSQHPKGRAADIVHAILKPSELFNLVLETYSSGKLPNLGGIGLYSSFIHVDVRPRGPSNHLSIWGGTRPSNIV